MNTCLCSHDDLDHPGGACIRPACGCIQYRPDMAAKSAATEEGAA